MLALFYDGGKYGDQPNRHINANRIALSATPSLPLARRVQMHDELRVDLGDASIKLRSIAPSQRFDINLKQAGDLQLRCRFGGQQLNDQARLFSWNMRWPSSFAFCMDGREIFAAPCGSSGASSAIPGCGGHLP